MSLPQPYILNFGKVKIDDFIFPVVAVMLFVGISVAFIEKSVSALLIALSIPVFLIMLKYPEVTFVLFLNGGIIKSHQGLNLPGYLDLTILFGIITIIGILLGIIKKRMRFSLPPCRMLIPYVILVILGLVSLLYTPSPIYGADKFLRFVTITTLALFGPLFLLKTERHFNRFFLAFVLLAIALVTDSVVGEPQFQRAAQSIMAFGISYISFARCIGFAIIVVSVYFLFNISNKIQFIMICCIMPLLFFWFFMSSSRGPLVGLGASYLAILAYSLYHYIKDYSRITRQVAKRNFRIIRGLISVIVLALLVCIIYSSQIMPSFLRFSKLFLVEGQFYYARGEIFELALNEILTFHNVLFGIGIGGYNSFFDVGDIAVYPHNIILEIGCELGIIGLIAFVFLLWPAFRLIFDILRRADEKQYFTGITLLALIVFLGVNALVSGDINDNRILFTCVGCIYAYARIIKRTKI